MGCNIFGEDDSHLTPKQKKIQDSGLALFLFGLFGINGYFLMTRPWSYLVTHAFCVVPGLLLAATGTAMVFWANRNRN
ncbi:hypothetical protein [Acidithiobacillus ferriphilus]|uniref:hypothetical protein n=1 Tax=Acidithiobacillus ferriphilus TaxID=1689834 RepID=UPI002DBD2A2E|nr:hypothetical protein [Acidithiobacillus ferriphilus]MEB8474817.1 hypothetical protein [Acidithiobacillus ferriphilus]